jgi:hypothetical protein
VGGGAGGGAVASSRGVGGRRRVGERSSATSAGQKRLGPQQRRCPRARPGGVHRVTRRPRPGSARYYPGPAQLNVAQLERLYHAPSLVASVAVFCVRALLRLASCRRCVETAVIRVGIAHQGSAISALLAPPPLSLSEIAGQIRSVARHHQGDD